MNRAAQASVFTVAAGAEGPLLDQLCARFPQVDRATWASRLERGLVQDQHGKALVADMRCKGGMQVRYFREVEEEPEATETERILHRDERILVVDKPAFMPVTPAGPYLKRSLLVRLRASTGIETLSPVHRLDRETAGLVLFAADREALAACHQIFEEGRVEKHYLAVARMEALPEARAWTVENRLDTGEPFFRMQVVEGPPNARSHVRLLEMKEGLGLFEVRLDTGKKHQIRLHLAGLGFPILHDRLYPQCQPEGEDDPGAPLQLLAARLAFRHPFSGEELDFRSERRLSGF